MKLRFRHIHYMLLVVMAAIITACASIGRPNGGPKDEEPPVFVHSNPAPGSLNVNRNKIEIYFDENVQLDDASSKLVISPVQKQMPSISAVGHRVSVELKDTLVPNATYTIDFADAICDLNEKNVLDGFALDFATGDTIDSLRISGMVLQARNLEPAQGMIVGLYSNLADSAIKTLPLERIARTNQYGQFTIRNLKPGDYRVYALNDNNRDYHWDRSEDVAFYDVTVSPSTAPIEVTDTLRNSENGDSIVKRPGVQYLPNDILLSWFNEDYKSQYMLDYSRPERRKVVINFAAPSDTFPEITVVSGKLAGKSFNERAVLKNSEKRDSLEFWIRDTTLVQQDSLLMAVRYLRTDTTDNLSWTTDTLKFYFKDQAAKKKKKKEEEEADSLSVPKIEFLTFTAATSSQQELNKPVVFKAGTPIDSINREAIKLYIQHDTIWDAVAKCPELVADSLNPTMQFSMMAKWDPGAKYRIEIDSAAIFNIYNEWNNAIKHEFTVKTEDEYSNLFFIFPQINDSAVVELLNGSDAVQRIAPVKDGVATFDFLAPGTYYARMFLDANNNGMWDTGNVDSKLQPEEVYYYPAKLAVKKNWDIEQTWNIYELPVDAQKPDDIKKNKPKTKKGEKEKTKKKNGYDDEDEDEDEDSGEFGSGWKGTSTNQYDNYRNSSTSGSNSRY